VFRMRGIFWNSNGFKDPKKHKFISDLTKENNLDFIAVSETRRSNFALRFLKNLCSRRDYLWHSGMLLGVDARFLILELSRTGIIMLNFIYTTKVMNSSGR
jgi:hypothetical protein